MPGKKIPKTQSATHKPEPYTDAVEYAEEPITEQEARDGYSKVKVKEPSKKSAKK